MPDVPACCKLTGSCAGHECLHLALQRVRHKSNRFERVRKDQPEQVRKLARTSQEEGLAPADRDPAERGQAPLPDLF